MLSTTLPAIMEYGAYPRREAATRLAAEGKMGEPYAGLVLVVDDDAMLRRAMRDFLMQCGCAVLEARDSYDGLFTCAQYGNSLNLLITEINLLPVGGIKLAENALRLWPRMQVLCTSADADIKGVQHWMRYLHAEFIAKPFTPPQLQQAVFRLLGRRVQDPPGETSSADKRIPPPAEPSPGPMARNPMFWLTEF